MSFNLPKNLFTRVLVNSSVLVLTLSLSCISLNLTGCAGSSLPNPIEKPSGFLPDYSLLKPVANPPAGTQIYTYKNPDVSRGDYRSVMIDPVIIYQSANANNASNDNQTPEQIKAQAQEQAQEKLQAQIAQPSIQSGIKSVVSQKMPITNRAGAGVARLSVAITGAMLEKEGLKPWNLIPVSAVITMASKASGMDSKTPALMIELKFTDSLTGKLLKETVTIIHGDSFRDQANTDTEFQALAEQWVKAAMAYSAKQS